MCPVPTVLDENPSSPSISLLPPRTVTYVKHKKLKILYTKITDKFFI